MEEKQNIKEHKITFNIVHRMDSYKTLDKFLLGINTYGLDGYKIINIFINPDKKTIDITYCGIDKKHPSMRGFWNK